MAIKSFKRFEKKYILSREQYEELMLEVLKYMNEDKFCKNGKKYSIFNIYYDTENNDVIRHSIAKPYYKEKLRLRSYSIPKDLNDKVFLELKKKINGIVNKRRVSLTLGQFYDFFNYGKRPELSDYINNQVLNEIEYYLKNNKVQPNVYISYERSAYFGKKDKNFRITFDSNILARRDKLSLEDGKCVYHILDEDKYLMEVKILGAIPMWLVSIFSKLKIYNTHYSKYGNEFIMYSQNEEKQSIKEREIIC
ncbi:VTC domain-containing protein [Clostridium sp. DSM 8431]|uniref:polyphosphate polymerase domain-containing protein n=1 Tax=Clostridium sp. DSM 8431 TaxID=1761781 RepID=UPI0008E280D4|nr:polyphosphate polymerase domain-containing protein [Clostridium sp. DSM 8431]SFU58680.1 VTC domain-containing protein [Clostridium sp. DSM 8431]